jgi:hypothetical protein
MTTIALAILMLVYALWFGGALAKRRWWFASAFGFFWLCTIVAFLGNVI